MPGAEMGRAAAIPNRGEQSALPFSNTVPLCVDLDGTLIRSDTLWEGFWSALRSHPLACLWSCFSLLVSRAQFKRNIARLAIAETAHLPYREEVLAFLRSEARAGRPLILVTAADELVARRVAEHLQIFSQVVASDGTVNRIGNRKLEAIRAIAAEFLYAGDSMADLPVWKAAAGAIVVGSSRQVLRALQRNEVQVVRHFPDATRRLEAVRRALRIHQWPKNFLVFLPIFLGHRVRDLHVWTSGALAALAFCLAASFGYVVNDLLDLEADRRHLQKRTRPFACGDLPITMGFVLLASLTVASVGLCLTLPLEARLSVAAYLVFSLSYSFYLKTKLLADVVGLAILYALRVIAGGTATGIVISPWTLAFCLFLFYSLALMKRLGELRLLPDHQFAPSRRGYRKADLPVIGALGAASGILSVVVFALYINSPEVRDHYRSPTWLWLACPVILYWFGRIWILANRGDVAEDPLLFSLKDKVSYVVGACIALIWLLASVVQLGN
jgi:4-hydroxybenzoate polyprenyltransferase